MAYNQYSIRYTTGRQSNLALLIKSLDRSTIRTSGTTMTAVSSVADSSYASGRLSATERVTSNSTGTGEYYFSAFPALTSGDYVLEIYDVITPSNSSPGPADIPLAGDGTTIVNWDGTDLKVP